MGIALALSDGTRALEPHDISNIGAAPNNDIRLSRSHWPSKDSQATNLPLGVVSIFLASDQTCNLTVVVPSTVFETPVNRPGPNGASSSSEIDTPQKPPMWLHFNVFCALSLLKAEGALIFTRVTEVQASEVEQPFTIVGLSATL